MEPPASAVLEAAQALLLQPPDALGDCIRARLRDMWPRPLETMCFLYALDAVMKRSAAHMPAAAHAVRDALPAKLPPNVARLVAHWQILGFWPWAACHELLTPPDRRGFFWRQELARERSARAVARPVLPPSQLVLQTDAGVARECCACGIKFDSVFAESLNGWAFSDCVLGCDGRPRHPDCCC
jgi:hypothetical protein